MFSIIWAGRMRDMQRKRCAGDSRRQVQSGDRPSCATAPLDAVASARVAATSAASYGNNSTGLGCSKRAAAFAAVLHGCGIDVYPSYTLTPTFGSGGVVPIAVTNQRFISRPRSRVIPIMSQPDIDSMFVLFSKKSQGKVETSPQLPELPSSPEERQKAFVEKLVGFVKAHDAGSAMSLYGMAGELGVRPTENVFNAVLSLCDGERVSQGVRVLSDMRGAGFIPAENHYAFLLRAAARRGAYEEAFARLREMVSTGARPRLRSYTPLLHGLCEKPDMALASEVWAHMTEQGVRPTPEEYIAVIRGWVLAGELEERALDGSVDTLFQELGDSAFELNPLAAAIPEETLPSVNSQESVTDGAKIRNNSSRCSGDSGNKSSCASYLQALLGAFTSCSAASDGRGDYFSSPGHLAAGVASVSDDGECGCCGARLKVLGLNAAERARVRSALMKLDAENRNAVTLAPQDKADETRQRDSFIVTSGKGVSRKRRAGDGGDVGSAKGNLGHFAQWLEGRRRGGSRFTTVVDGCNVAYFNQNKEGGRFQVSQVDLVVRLLESQGERVLVVLPERYLRSVVPNSSRWKGIQNDPSTLTPEDLDIIAEWDQRGALYRCVDGTDDDLFWMYFTVSFDAASADVETQTSYPDYNPGDSDGVNVGDVDLGRDLGALSRSDGAADDPRDSGGSCDADPVFRRWGGMDGCSGGDGDGTQETSGDDEVSVNIDRRLMVVSNDEMRNHRMALLEPVPFKRWRNSQVRGFQFLSAETPGTAAPESPAPAPGPALAASLPDAPNTLDDPEGAAGQSRSRNLPGEHEEHLFLQRLRSDMSTLPRPIVRPPPSFTRDMQMAGRAWHVPIRGLNGGPGTKWLCVKFGPSSDRGRRQPVEARFEDVR